MTSHSDNPCVWNWMASRARHATTPFTGLTFVACRGVSVEAKVHTSESSLALESIEVEGIILSLRRFQVGIFHSRYFETSPRSINRMNV